MSNFGITLKTLKVYGDKTNKVENYLAGEKVSYIYPKNTKRVIRKLCFFPPKIKKIVQTCTIENVTEGSADIIYYNKWHDIKTKKLKTDE
jgi:hypothetical protein